MKFFATSCKVLSELLLCNKGVSDELVTVLLESIGVVLLILMHTM